MTSRCDPRFEPLLERHFSREALDRHPGSVLGLWHDLRVAFYNTAWIRFAEENDGLPAIDAKWGLGARYLDAIAAPLRPFYADLFAAASDSEDVVHPARHEYECSSAETYRRFVMDVHVLPGRTGYVVVNTLAEEHPHDARRREPRPPDPALYRGEDGLIRQCAHCRRIRRADEARWDWVPEWVDRHPGNVTHGVCEICFDYYYPRPDSEDTGAADGG